MDVNVHPAKTVVKFLSDKTVFDAVHYTVKDALDREGQPAAGEKKPFYQTMTAQEFRETTPAPQGVKLPFVSGRPVGSAGADRPTVNRFAPAAPTVQTPRQTVRPAAAPQGDVWQVRDAAPEAGKPFTVPSGREGVVYRITPPDVPEDSPAREQAAAEAETVPAAVMPEAAGANDTTLSAPEAAPVQQELEMPETADSGETPWRIAGEVLKTYIICEDGEQNVWLIDKHAAHERIRFDALKADPVPPMAQQLLTPAAVTLSAEEYGAVLEQLDVLAGYGFLCEDFGDGTVLVREIPDYIRAEDAAATLEELARKLLLQRADPDGARDELLHTMACKSAIKAGMTTDAARAGGAGAGRCSPALIRYCPHGRPVACEAAEIRGGEDVQAGVTPWHTGGEADGTAGGLRGGPHRRRAKRKWAWRWPSALTARWCPWTPCRSTGAWTIGTAAPTAGGDGGRAPPHDRRGRPGGELVGGPVRAGGRIRAWTGHPAAGQSCPSWWAALGCIWTRWCGAGLSPPATQGGGAAAGSCSAAGPDEGIGPLLEELRAGGPGGGGTAPPAG